MSALGVLYSLYIHQSAPPDDLKTHFPISPVVKLTPKQWQRISGLRSPSDVQGIFYATHKKTKKIHPQYVRISGDNKGRMDFSSWDLDIDQKTAGASVHPIRQNKNGRFDNRDFAFFMDCQARFGPKEALQEKIHF